MSQKPPRLTREEALLAKPLATPVVSREPLPEGGERVAIRFHPTGIQRWFLRAPEGILKKFELDPMGIEVLALCDGQKTVRYIIDAFAQRHKIHAHEAERAVTTFLFMMLGKGLVRMVLRE